MDKQIENLARELRYEGSLPERDLWPGIEAALDRESGAEPKRKSEKSVGLFRASTSWRIAAVAATLVLILGSGYFRSEPGLNPGSTELAVTDSSESSLLQSLNQTIADLSAAQAQDPQNLKLTRLSLLAHKSRTQLLCLKINY